MRHQVALLTVSLAACQAGGGSTTGLDAPIITHAVVQGTVVNSAGQLLDSVLVFFRELGDNQPPGESDLTDELGRYWIVTDRHGERDVILSVPDTMSVRLVAAASAA